MKRALIIGCGYTGRALARRLLRQGTQVSGTTRTHDSSLEGLTLHQLDLKAPGAVRLPEARDAVVYYMVSTLERVLAPEQPHLQPMRRVLQALERDPPRGLIYLSSTSVYGDRDGEWVDEGSALRPSSPWGTMRTELEQLALTWGAVRGHPVCVARLPEIYGPGRGPTERLLQPGHAVRYPARFSNRIHLDDLAQVLELLGTRLEPRLLLVSDNAPAPTLEVYQYAAELMGLGPIAVAPTVAGSDPNRLALQRDSKRCDNSRLRAWLPGALRYPTYREGIRAILSG